jgi:hypothetical protein
LPGGQGFSYAIGGWQWYSFGLTQHVYLGVETDPQSQMRRIRRRRRSNTFSQGISSGFALRDVSLAFTLQK